MGENMVSLHYKVKQIEVKDIYWSNGMIGFPL